MSAAATARKPESQKARKPHRFLLDGFTPEMDAAIARAYAQYTRNGNRFVISECAKALGVEKWHVCRRAGYLGLSRPKEPPWSEAEVVLLRQLRHYSEAIIRAKMAESGFHRSSQGIRLKRKRMNYSTRYTEDGYTANTLAGLLNVDNHRVLNLITQGKLRAERCGTLRTALQGGDRYWIRREDVRAFVVANTGEVDIRKVDAVWFIELLTGAESHSGDEEPTLP